MSNEIIPIRQDMEMSMPEMMANMMGLMSAMAEMMQATNRRMATLEEEVRRLNKVTPAQARAINAAIRNRSEAVCAMHRATGCEKEAAAAIRKALRISCGIRSVRDLPRCDFDLANRTVEMWDDYAFMRGLARRGQK